MTIKIYKKRVKWYFTYHCKEYELGRSQYFDNLSKLLDQNVIYFKLDNKYDSENSMGTLVPNDRMSIVFEFWPFIFLSSETYSKFYLRDINFESITGGYRVYVHLK